MSRAQGIGRGHKQQIIVRGRNCVNEATLVEDTLRKMMDVSANTGLPVESMQVRGREHAEG